MCSAWLPVDDASQWAPRHSLYAFSTTGMGQNAKEVRTTPKVPGAISNDLTAVIVLWLLLLNAAVAYYSLCLWCCLCTLC